VTSHTSHLRQGLANECEVIVPGGTAMSRIFAIDSGQF